MTSVFDSLHYRAYLKQLEASLPNKGWGFRSKIAKAAGCQTAYLSRVFQGTAELSLEQAESLNSLLGHSAPEGDFFILLVEYARAGTAPLKRRFEKKIKEAQEAQLILKDRFKVKEKLDREQQLTYYSAWYYSAIHVALSVPEFQTKDALVSHFRLSLAKVSDVLSFLISVGLAKEEKGRFKIGETRIHLGKESPLLAKHHLHWRMKAIQAFEQGVDAEGFHYSSVATLSHEDVLQIKGILVKGIEAANAVIAKSPEQTLYCLNVDFFEP